MKVTITTTPEQDVGIAHAMAAANAEIEARNAALPRDDKGNPVGDPEPLWTPATYVADRFARVLKSWCDQADQSALDAALADPDRKARLMAVAKG